MLLLKRDMPRKNKSTTTKQTGDREIAGTITRDQQMKMRRKVRRDIALESGISLASGTGVHGGDKRQQRRRDRHAGKIEDCYFDLDEEV